VPLWASSLIIMNPGHVVGRVLTLIPMTAPVTVMIRLGLSEIPAWELAVSIGLLILACLGLLVVASRVFRAFLLMYGKRPGLQEIVKSMREA